jgi:hypothetical protein
MRNAIQILAQIAENNPALKKAYIKEKELMHKKIEMKAAKALAKDADKYHAKAKSAKGIKKKHEKVEEKEARSASRDMKARAKKAHEY